jgi:hypothetical protein
MSKQTRPKQIQNRVAVSVNTTIHPLWPIMLCVRFISPHGCSAIELQHYCQRKFRDGPCPAPILGRFRLGLQRHLHDGGLVIDAVVPVRVIMLEHRGVHMWSSEMLSGTDLVANIDHLYRDLVPGADRRVSSR